MIDSRAHEHTDRKPSARSSTSLLVRCWLEPRAGGEPVVRGVIRNLATGEETLIGDAGAVSDHIVRQLKEDQDAAAAERRTTA